MIAYNMRIPDPIVVVVALKNNYCVKRFRVNVYMCVHDACHFTIIINNCNLQRFILSISWKILSLF